MLRMLCIFSYTDITGNLLDIMSAKEEEAAELPHSKKKSKKKGNGRSTRPRYRFCDDHPDYKNYYIVRDGKYKLQLIIS